MNTHLLRNPLVLVLIFVSFPISMAFGQATSSNYTGANFGNWSNPMNWTPAVVPNNNGTATFDVTIDNKTATLDIDTTISSLTTSGGSPHLVSTDHNLTSAATETVGSGEIGFTANQADVKFDLGNYASFSGTTLDDTTGFLLIKAAAGRTATLQFNGRAHCREQWQIRLARRGHGEGRG